MIKEKAGGALKEGIGGVYEQEHKAVSVKMQNLEFGTLHVFTEDWFWLHMITWLRLYIHILFVYSAQ